MDTSFSTADWSQEEVTIPAHYHYDREKPVAKPGHGDPVPALEQHFGYYDA